MNKLSMMTKAVKGFSLILKIHMLGIAVDMSIIG